MAKHELFGWRFQFDDAVRRFGYCSYKKEIISISRNLVELNSEEKVRDTILHEIAHALCDRKDGHNSNWIFKARAIGCDGERCYNHEEIETPELKWKATCSKCGRVVNYARRPKNRRSCGECTPHRFDENCLLIIEANEKYGK